MDRRDQHLNIRSRATVGMLFLLLWLTVTAGMFGLFTGTSFARYQSAGSAIVQFAAVGKPQVTVVETEVSGGSKGFTVTCNRDTEGACVRIRLYGSGTALQSLMVYSSEEKQSYTLIPYALSASSVKGQETNSSWVYILTDGNGQEVLFASETQGMAFVLNPTNTDADISQLQICAEVVRK